MTYSGSVVRMFGLLKFALILVAFILQPAYADPQIGAPSFQIKITGGGDVGGLTGDNNWLKAGDVKKVTPKNLLSVSVSCGADIYIREDVKSYTSQGDPMPASIGNWINKGNSTSLYKLFSEDGGGGGPGGDPGDPTSGGSEEREYYLRLEPAVVPDEEDSLENVEGASPVSTPPGSPGRVAQSTSCCQQSAALGTSPGLVFSTTSYNYDETTELEAHYEYPLGGILFPGERRTKTHGTLVFTSALSNTSLATNWHQHFGIRTMMSPAPYQFVLSIGPTGRGIFQTDAYVYEVKWQGGIRIAKYPVSEASAIWDGIAPSVQPEEIYLIRRVDEGEDHFEFSCFKAGSAVAYRVDRYYSDYGPGFISEKWDIDGGKLIEKYEKRVTAFTPTPENYYHYRNIEITRETLEPRFQGVDNGLYEGHIVTSYERTTHELDKYPYSAYYTSLKEHVYGVDEDRTKISYEYDKNYHNNFWESKTYALADTANEVLVSYTAGGDDHINGSYTISPWLDTLISSQQGYRVRKSVFNYLYERREEAHLFVPGTDPSSRYSLAGASMKQGLYRKFTFIGEADVDGVPAYHEETLTHSVFGRFAGEFGTDYWSPHWRFEVREFYADFIDAGHRIFTDPNNRPKYKVKGDLFRDIDLPSRVTQYDKDTSFFVTPEEADRYPTYLGSYLQNWVMYDLKASASKGGSSLKQPFKSTRLEKVRCKYGPVSESEQVWNGSSWVTMTTRFYVYSPGGKLLNITQDGVTIESRTYPDPSTVVTLDIIKGTETVETYDSATRSTTITKKGVSASGPFPAQPDIVTSVNEHPVFHPDRPPPPGSLAGTVLPIRGISKTEITSAGGLSITRSTAVNAQGDVVHTHDGVKGMDYTKKSINDRLVGVASRLEGAYTLTSTNYLDGRLKEKGGSGQVQRVFTYGVKTSFPQGIEEVEKIVDGNTETVVRSRLVAGNGEIISETNNGITTEYIYDEHGRVIAKTTAGRSYRYEYDYRNLVSKEGWDVNNDGQLTAGSTDTLTERDRYYQLDAGAWWLVNVESTYVQDGNSAVKLTTTRREKQGAGATTVTEIVDPDGNLETTTRTVSGRFVTTTIVSGRYPGRSSIQVEYNGLLVSSQDFTQSQPVLYKYDALGRQIQAMDTGTQQLEVRDYNPANGQLVAVRNGSAERTSYGYYSADDVNCGRLKWVQNNAGSKTFYAYNIRGQLTHQWGRASHPLRYTYDERGVLKYLDTFPTQTPEAWTGESLPVAFSGSVYDRREFLVVNGRLQERTYGFGAGGVSYTYNADGSLQQRQWPNSGSGQTTTYTYAGSGALKKIDYADSTPDVDVTYDRSGRLATLSDASGVRSFAYQPNGDVVTTYSSGLLSGLVLTKTHNSAGMVSGISWSLGGEAHQAGYTYDSQMRLESVTLGPVNASPLVTAAYGYHPDTARVHTLTRPVAGGLPLVGTFAVDGEGRRDALSWKRGNYFYGGHDYKLNAAGLRSEEGRLDGTRLTYRYSSRGELEEARRYKEPGNSLRPDWSHAYAYDDSGTRRSSTTPEGETLSHTLESVPSSTDTVYTSSGETKQWVRGRAHPQASVTVNGNTAARDGELWRSLVTKPSAESAFEVSVLAGREDIEPTPPTPVTQTTVLQPSTTQWKYDARGNLKEDGRWVYIWDLENRLVAQEQKYPGDTDAGAKPVKRLEFAYDAYSRRVSKTVLGNERTFNGSLVNGTWTFAKQTVFLWQDWKLLAEFVRTTPSGSWSLRRSYLWGLDIDGTLAGVGGVGGLLWVVDYVPGGTGSNRQLAPWYDGNGNIMGWMENEAGQILPLHRLEHDPYGRLLVAEETRVLYTKKQKDLGVTKEWLDRPAFGFSSKYEDVETGLLYYGHRYYSPEMGRWISRDPSGEDGGVNLYGMVGNDPVNSVDPLGLQKWQLTVVGDNPVRDRTTGSTGNPVRGQHVAAMAAATEFFPLWGPEDGAEIKAPKYLLDGEPPRETAWVLLVAKTSRGRKMHGPDFPPPPGLRFSESRDRSPKANFDALWPAYLRNNIKISTKESGEIIVEKNPGEVWQVQSEGSANGLGSALAAQLTYRPRQSEDGWEVELTYSVSGGWSSEGIVDHNGAGFFPLVETGAPSLEQFIVGGGAVNDDMRHHPQSRPRDSNTGQGAPIQVKLRIRSQRCK